MQSPNFLIACRVGERGKLPPKPNMPASLSPPPKVLSLVIQLIFIILSSFKINNVVALVLHAGGGTSPHAPTPSIDDGLPPNFKNPGMVFTAQL